MFLKAVLLLSLTGSVLALSLMLLRRISRGRISSGFFYWAWLIVLLRFALPVGVIPMEQPRETPAYAPRQEYSEPLTAEPISDRETIPVPEREFAPNVTVQTETKKSLDFKKLLSSEEFRLTVWAAGAAAVVLKYTVSYLVFRAKLRAGLEPVNDFELRLYISVKQRGKPELFKSAAVSTPMLLGVKDPMLVLPKREYSWEMLNNILRHEFTHYKRGDIVLKWLSMLIFSLHWFNPLCRLFLRELDKVCELSCDEQLLKTMDSRQKQSYGETLLELAGGKHGALVTCLAMEKHVLKERLEQIMKYKNKGRLGMIATALSVLLLAGCTAAMGPGTAPETAETPAAAPMANDVQGEKVYTVDEFLDAIEPGASIVLAEGTFNLSDAKNYGVEPDHGNYGWVEYQKGDYGLIIRRADGLKITGAGMGKTSIVTEPREADVIYFMGGRDISLAGLTLGHTEGVKSTCSGGVLKLTNTKNFDIDSCELFGCGTVGVFALDSYELQLRNSLIRDCNLKAVHFNGCRNVSLNNCEIYNCGEDGFALIDVWESQAVGIFNSFIHENKCENFMHSVQGEISMLGCVIEDNRMEKAMFANAPSDIVVDGCSFENNSSAWWYAEDSEDNDYYANIRDMGFSKAVDLQGNVLGAEDFEAMEHKPCELADAGGDGADAGYQEISAKTVDEFLAAIGPNRKITLDGGLFDLSTASDYGKSGNEWYYWRDCFDGSELIITGVENLSIAGLGKEKTTIAAIPRYANVLSFENCGGISLAGFTAGHTEEPGSCTGGVLHFNCTDAIYIEDCGMFGCGTVGIYAQQCKGIEVVKSDIYDCSIVGFSITQCRDVEFKDCRMWDLPVTAVGIGDTDVIYNGELLYEGGYTLEDGVLKRRETEPQAVPHEPVPTPELGDFRIWYGELPIITDCTIRVGDEPIRFFAGRNTVDVTEEAVTWTVSNTDAIELDPAEGLGYFCWVKVVSAVKGGVQLTATRGDESATITVYCVE